MTTECKCPRCGKPVPAPPPPLPPALCEICFDAVRKEVCFALASGNLSYERKREMCEKLRQLAQSGRALNSRAIRGEE